MIEESIDEVFATGITDTTYTATTLTTGMFYTFKVLARNAFGTSAYTETIVILCAEEPAKPDAPTTLRENNNFIIDWVAPSDNGSEILSYTVYLGMSDLTFSLELSSCDGSDLGIIE